MSSSLSTFAPTCERPTSIVGLSERRFLPRIDKIRGGIKKTAQNGKTYPAETDYFVCPDYVQRVLGDEKPKSITIVFPVSDRATIAPQYLARYNQAGKRLCCGNGQWAIERGENGADKQIQCPCDHYTGENECKRDCACRMNILFMIPEVSISGVFQYDTSSKTAITEINSAMDFIMTMTGGIIAGIPLLFERVEKAIPDPSTGKMMKHFIPTLRLPMNYSELKSFRRNAERASLCGVSDPVLPSLVEMQDEADEFEYIPQTPALPNIAPVATVMPEPQPATPDPPEPKQPPKKQKTAATPEPDEAEKLRTMIRRNLEMRKIDAQKFDDWLFGNGKPTIGKMSLDALNKMADEDVMDKAAAKFFEYQLSLDDVATPEDCDNPWTEVLSKIIDNGEDE